jgi:hypothetical protein
VTTRTLRIALPILLLLALLPVSRLAAQVCDTNKKDRATTTVSPVAQSIPTPIAAEFNAGASNTVSYTVTVATNKPFIWYLCLASVSTDAGTVNGYTKPLSDFEFSIDGTTWTPFSTSLTQVKTGTGNATITVLVRSRLSYALDQPLSVSTPGSYGPVSFEFQTLM